MTQHDLSHVGLSPIDVALELREDINKGNRYARRKKRSFRGAASTVKLTSLALSAAATIILGLQNLGTWAGLGFSLVAVTTVINAVEPFFNWRSRWVLMEEMQYRFYRLRDDLDYYLSKTPPDQVATEQLDHFFETYQELWNDVSQRWLEQRHSDHTK